jgi:hypothetical protein
VKIDYEGREYEFDITRLTVAECEEIEKFTSARGVGDWSNQLTAGNTKAYQALWWVIRRQDGQNPGAVAVRDPALFPIALNNAYAAAEKAELAAQVAKAAAEAAEADPTLPLSAPSSPEKSAGTPTTPAALATAALSPPG